MTPEEEYDETVSTTLGLDPDATASMTSGERNKVIEEALQKLSREEQTALRDRIAAKMGITPKDDSDFALLRAATEYAMASDENPQKQIAVTENALNLFMAYIESELAPELAESSEAAMANPGLAFTYGVSFGVAVGIHLQELRHA